ncbi:fructosamine kinase family protein [Actinomyces sp. MRS3W]|uniref:fructosamine kinase family protein n=1 Tax=Actinomyces sp. MRS3W TaxID=2800796 RepID=UPI0028FD0770|nr:fructosamine kinase family protein [Actinomyces sp. MRS3W]MDU0349072.1 fructosamine kinase family protein [Actinomyces sp. MRS3W]
MNVFRSTIRKQDDLPGATRLEAQGLAWLAQAMDDGGAAVVPARAGDGWLEEPRLTDTRVTATAAEAFGRALAVTHAALAPAFGAAPPGWDGRTQMGRSNIRLRPHAEETGVPRRWGEFYAEDRIAPYIAPGRDAGTLSAADAALLERVCTRLADGDFDSDQPELTRRAAAERGAAVAVARTHGDLWTGNVMWVPAAEVATWAPAAATGGAAGRERRPDRGTSTTVHGGNEPVGVLIDPLAQGAHAETDLAALGVFGQPYLERIVAAYNEVSPLADGWRERVGLHQLHMLMIHVFLFGGGYGPQAVSVARRYA